MTGPEVTDQATTADHQARRTPARQAVADVAPFCLALIPFGLAIGNASAIAGLSPWEAAFGAISLLAGSAQLAAVETIGAGGGVLLTATVVGLINLRFVFYGAGVASWFADQSLGRRLLLAFPIVDQSFILCQERFEDETDPAARQAYYLAATTALVVTFLSCQLIAYRFGANIPDGIGLHLAAPLAFVGMLARAVTNAATLTAAVAAAAVTTLGAGFLGAFALPVGVALGVTLAIRAVR